MTSAAFTDVWAPTRADEEVRSASVMAVLAGLFLRDLLTLRHGFGEFLTRTLVFPTFFVFVFMYVLPRIGQGFGNPAIPFSTVAVPGIVCYAALFAGMYSVGIPLSMDFGLSGEILDRVLAPVSTYVVGLEKIAFGACQSIFAAAIVFPLALIIPARRPMLTVPSWPLLVSCILVVGILSAAMGLAVGTIVKPQHLGFTFTVVTIGLAFLGCTYYSWGALSHLRWLQIAVLANPLVYMAEGLRGTITPSVPHMPVAISLSVGALYAVVLGAIGLRLFVYRTQT